MRQDKKYKLLLIILLKWITVGGVIGFVIGSTTSLLLSTNDLLGNYREKNDWLIYMLPLAGLVIGYLYMKLGKSGDNDSAKGNILVIDGVHGKARVLKRMGPIVYIGTFLTVLFGGSTGREGAAIQMGGSVAQSVNQLFNIDIVDRKIFLMSGISAGFGAAFGAPVTGAVFGMEMTSLGKLKYEAIIPCLIASFVGHYVSVGVWGVKHEEEFIIQTVPDVTLLNFSKVLLAAVLFGLISAIYCQLRHGIQKHSEHYFKKNHILRAFVGGVLIVILFSLVGSQVYNGRGLEMIEQSFAEPVPRFAFFGKLLFTAITMGFGFVGGEAIPLFFMGATLGNTLAPLMDLPLSFLAAIGMIATFCAGANTPIVAFLLGVEMFQGEGVGFFFVACITSYIISGQHGLWPSQTVYEPKSRLFNITNGKTIASVEKEK